jgi:hypothetical protein
MPLIWETIHPNKLGQWILAQQQSGPPPSAYELFAWSPVQELLNNPLVAPLKSVLRVHPDSGAVDFDVQALPAAGRSEEDVMAFSVAIANVLDPRKACEWAELDAEERGSPPHVKKAVGREFWLYVDDMRPVGPGGRITYYPRRHLVEIVVRRRGPRLGGSWRNSTDLANRVSNYLELDETVGTRLRGGFGYYEASKYERQFLLRPAFLFLLDRPTATEGPRWRVATTVAATELPDRSATTGVDSVTGCA